MPRERDVNLNLRVRPEEREQLQALAEDRDLPASAVIRHMVREAYARMRAASKKARARKAGAR